MALFVIFAVAAGGFIRPHHLGANVGHDVNVGDDLQLAWFSASIAIVGGALGSLVERDEAVRDAAYRARRPPHRVEGRLTAAQTRGRASTR